MSMVEADRIATTMTRMCPNCRTLICKQFRGTRKMKQGFRGIVGTVIDTSQILISQIVLTHSSEAYLSGGSKIFKPHEIENTYGWAGWW